MVDCDAVSTIASTDTPSTVTGKYIVGPTAATPSGERTVTTLTFVALASNPTLSSRSLFCASKLSNWEIVKLDSTGAASTTRTEDGLVVLDVDLPGASTLFLFEGQFLAR